MIVVIASFIIYTAHAIVWQTSRAITTYGSVKRFMAQRSLLAIKIDNLYPLTDEELYSLAKYDLLITYAASYNIDKIKRIRIYNPEIYIFGYRNVAFIDERATSDIELARSKGWILKDTLGNEVYEKNFPSLKLVDVGNVEYQMWLAERVRKQMIETVPMDGIFGDCTGAMIDLYSISSRPINPRTGTDYLDIEWRDDTINLVRNIKEATGLPYLANGAGLFCGSGATGFWKNKYLAEPLLDTVDGVLLEGFIRWDNEPWRTESSWKYDIAFLSYVNKKEKIAIAWTICSGSLPPSTTQYQVAMYGYTSYLLAISGHKSYFRAKGYDNEFYNITKIALGYPIEEYHIRADVPIYEREFSKVLVLVNPTDNNYTILFDRYYFTLNGQPVSEILLPPKSGMILIKNT